MKFMKVGKLTNPELIECVLSVIKRRRKEVIVPSSLAQDCASFEIEDRILISTDPITGADEDVGALAIKINVNDVSAAGGEPVLAVLTVLAPPHATLEQIKKVMSQAEREAERSNLEIVGGHTEFTDAVNKIIVNATVIGRTKKHITANSAHAGDSIIITKTVGIEGTSILASDCAKKLEQFLTKEELERAIEMGKSISIAKEAAIARQFDVSAMHDITEGGIFGAIAEMAESAGVGATIDVKSVRVHDVTKKICATLHTDVYRLISSGSLIISAKDPTRVLEALDSSGIPAAKIGEFTSEKAIIADFGDRIEYLETRNDQLFEAVKRCK